MEQQVQPRISVIIPIYKVERYLARCLDSLLAQTYQNLEIIAVDDGSPDNCGAIADEYAKKDARIRVIHQKNAGVAAARNAGLDAATGDYIGFVDPDDYALPEMYETLYGLMQQYDADIAECASKLDTDTGREDESGILLLEGCDAMLIATITDRIATPVWSKLYRADCWKGVRCPVGLVYEDTLTIPDIAQKEPRLVRTEKKLYFYNRENESIMRGRKSEKHLRSREAVYDRYEAFFAERPQLADLRAFHVCSGIPARVGVIKRSDDISKQRRKEHQKKMYSLFLKHWPVAVKTEYFKAAPKSKQLLWTIYRYCPALAQWLAEHYTKKRTK